MSSRATSAAALTALRSTLTTDLGTGRDRLADDVVALFDQFREPLLRYLSGFGLPVPDSEDVIQEVFLSLFRHLRDGKSRENLSRFVLPCSA